MLLGLNTILPVKPQVSQQSKMKLLKEASGRQRHGLCMIRGIRWKSLVALQEIVHGPSDQTFTEPELLSEQTKGMSC